MLTVLRSAEGQLPPFRFSQWHYMFYVFEGRDWGSEIRHWVVVFFLPPKPLCCRSVAQSCPAPHGLKHARIPSTISQSLLRLVSIESVMPSNHLILCCHILLLPLICPSFRVFSIKSALCIRWPEYWSFTISPSSEYSGLISFRLDWFDLLAVQGALKSLLPYHNLKASVFWRLAFFMAHHSHLSMNTGKTIALTLQTFVGKMMSLLCNMLSRCVIVFLPRSKHLLISWLQSPSAVILEPKKIKFVTAVFPLLFAMKW